MQFSFIKSKNLIASPSFSARPAFPLQASLLSVALVVALDPLTAHSQTQRLPTKVDKVIVTVDQHGNTSAASIPLALDSAVRSGKVKKGDTLLLEGVGGGFTWGAVLLNL